MLTPDGGRRGSGTPFKGGKKSFSKGGLFYLQNGLSLDVVKPNSHKEEHILNQLRQFSAKQWKTGRL